MELFKKEFCCICGKKARLLQRTKLTDGEYLCVNCQVSHCSTFFKPNKYTKEETIQHMNSLKKQEELYKQEFTKSKVFKYSQEGNTIIFSDELGLFTYGYNDEGQKFHELFRYDQISNYYLRAETDVNNETELWKVSVIIELENHPYCKKIEVICALAKQDRGIIKETVAEPLIKKLDEIFGKPHEEIKAKVRTNLSVNVGGVGISTADISRMSKFIKNGLGKDEHTSKNEKYVKESKSQYTERANQVEQKYEITI